VRIGVESVDIRVSVSVDAFILQRLKEVQFYQRRVLDGVVRKPARKLDKLGNQLIVKSSDQETPPDGASNTTQGLTDHAEVHSMAAESNSNLTLSSRQLLPAAIDDFSVSRQVEYYPPSDIVVGQFARDVCGGLSEVIQSADLSTRATRQGFQQFMAVVVRIVVKQANAKGGEWKTQSEAEPLSNAA